MKPAVRQLLVPKRRIGQVANHTFTTPTISLAQQQIMSRSLHRMQEDVSWVQLVFPCWQDNEQVVGANATITASVEYPAGVFTQATFAGSASGTILDGNHATTDRVYVNIPSGVDFFVRSYFTNSVGIVYNARAGLTTLGEAATYAASGVVDQTMSGTVSATGGASGNILYGPIAIVSHSKRKSVALIGDSRVQGPNDTVNATAQHHIGEQARSFGDSYAYMNLGVSGTRASQFASNTSKVVQLAKAYATHVVGNFGINDIGSQTAAQCLANVQMVRTLIGLPYFHTTVAPRSTSTDAWATTVNQTTHATNAVRLTLNGLLRAVPAGFSGVFELADVVESARDSGLWKVNYTADGLHENQAAFEAIRDSGVIPPATVFAA